MKPLLIFLGLLISTISMIHASETDAKQTSVWKVSKIIEGKQQIVYFGGTIHLLRESDFPLPKAFDLAYEQADELIFEVDIDEASSVASQTKMMSLIMLPAGQTIKEIVSANNYKSIVDYAKQSGMPIQTLEGMTPTGLSLVLTQIEMTKFGFTPMGVDLHFDLKAKDAGIKRAFLETIDDQIGFLASMGDDPNKLIEYTFKDMQRLKSMMNEMVTAWRTGSELELITIELKAEFPEIYDSLILNRNKNWIAKLESQFLDDETEFVLVGVGHLTGEDSVINMLANKGYNVEQLNQ